MTSEGELATGDEIWMDRAVARIWKLMWAIGAGGAVALVAWRGWWWGAGWVIGTGVVRWRECAVDEERLKRCSKHYAKYCPGFGSSDSSVRVGGPWHYAFMGTECRNNSRFGSRPVGRRNQRRHS